MMDKSDIKPVEVKVQLLKVQEIGCSINTNILSSKEKLDDKKLNIQFGFNNKFNLKENLFILSVAVKYQYIINNKPVILVELISENHFRVLNLKNLIKIIDEKSFDDKANLLPTLFGISISTLRGMLVVKTAGTILANHPLPIVNPTLIINSLINKNLKK